MCLHSLKDDTDHLAEGCFGCGLVNQVFASKVDIIACPHRLQQRGLMDLTCVGCYSCEKCLDDLQLNAFICLRSNKTPTDGLYNPVNQTLPWL